ncbi:glycosyltransferase family 4 protein [Gordonia alkanivorans]|uniref:glycosyltransferase family 4 protein n=1 Tax=Gordonia alkanivorans TaxID=84096 RepID=UPI0018CC0BF8
MLAQSRAVIALSDDAARFFRSQSDNVKTVRIPNFGPVSDLSRRSSGAAENRFGWVYVGRLTPEKNVMWLAEYAQHLAEPLTIVGGGPLTNEVGLLASQSGGSVEFVGQKTEAEVEDILLGARGIVVPSLWAEGVPTVALKALALGCPVLVSNACSAATELTKRGAGIVFDPGCDVNDPKSLAVGAMEVRSRQAIYSNRARQLFEEDFSPEVWRQRISELYTECFI